MRLLNAQTFKLESFLGDKTPPYAILSHTWTSEELLFDDMKTPDDATHDYPSWLSVDSPKKTKKGRDKALGSCALARRDGLGYVWIDTCCIDKSSSAELSEAINSMFRWYRHAVVCYAYLEDVDLTDPNRGGVLDGCRWFTRGWTLQELIAPSKVVFFDKNWTAFGERDEMADVIAGITSVDPKILRRDHWEGCPWWDAKGLRCEFCCSILSLDCLDLFSVATRMSWASGRQTTRVEDQAYCLMGLFDVNMPLLYGEGAKAFTRLQEEIVRNCSDQSILAWSTENWGPFWPRRINGALPPPIGMFAKSPQAFLSQVFSDIDEMEDFQMSMVNGRMDIDVLLSPVFEYALPWKEEISAPYSWLAILNCYLGHDTICRPAILLRKLFPNEMIFEPLWRWQRDCIMVKYGGGIPNQSEFEVIDLSLDSELSSSKPPIFD